MRITGPQLDRSDASRRRGSPLVSAILTDSSLKYSVCLIAMTGLF
jgi:hypothetical protein